MPGPFIDATEYLQFLRDQEVASALNLSLADTFLVEVAFLNFWNRQLDYLPQREYVDEFFAYADCIHRGRVTVELEFEAQDFDEPENILFIYQVNPEDPPGRRALQIIHNENVIYKRTAEQDEKSQWHINCMAGNPEVTDENGNTLFVGDPTTI